jgi:hypothetical protein
MFFDTTLRHPVDAEQSRKNPLRRKTIPLRIELTAVNYKNHSERQLQPRQGNV